MEHSKTIFYCSLFLIARCWKVDMIHVLFISGQLNDTSPSISLESSHGTLTPSARSGRLAASSAKRKRFESKKVNR